jgi:hypothetical protein
MPTEFIVVLAAVGLLFAVFAVGLLYADYQTREFRD